MQVIAAALAAIVALPLAASAAAVEPVPILDWEVVSRRPHDPQAFTQGLLLEGDRLFESTGMWGASGVRESDPSSGEVRRAADLPEDLFGEGLALVEGELIQLTWQAGLARRWDAGSFEPLGTHRYDGEGWGLCYDGERLVMSDGSSALTFRDPRSFEPLGEVTVTFEGQPLERLNELECIADAVWANVWRSDAIVRIDPDDGTVTGVLDLRGLLEPHPAEAVSGAVLNGIAYDAAADTLLLTGKYWPELIEIRLLEPDVPAS